METLELLDAHIDQYQYYYDVKIPDLSHITNINKVVVCGMGGSAFPADIVADHIKELYKRDLVYVNRDYSLPYWVNQETLVIATSFSGSTEETLSCMNEALEKKIPVIGISMGGEISRICNESYVAPTTGIPEYYEIPYVALPKVVMPRFGAGFEISAILRILSELKLIPKQDEEINNIKILLEPLKINIKKTTEGIAKSIKDRLVIIYSDPNHHTAANLARICINETGKTIGYSGLYSESNHNELESLANSPYPMAMFLLTTPDTHKRIIERFELLPELLKEQDVIYKKANSNFEKILYQDIFYIMYFSYLAYYLALESGHDPVATPAQDEIKVLLKRTK